MTKMCRKADRVIEKCSYIYLPMEYLALGHILEKTYYNQLRIRTKGFPNVYFLFRFSLLTYIY